MKTLLQKLSWVILMSVHGLFLLALTGCDRGTKESPPTQQVKREVSGEVFIVLKNRETLKFSLADVALIDEAIAVAKFNALLNQTNLNVASLTNLSSEPGYLSVTPKWNKMIPDLSLALDGAQAEFDRANRGLGLYT